MLLPTRIMALALWAVVLLGCSKFTESTLMGEWNNSALEPTARVTYRADHTYFAHLEHRRMALFEEKARGASREVT
jgi:hypothetical protein